MPAFTKEKLLAAGELRTISQKELFHKLEEQGKLGILYRDHLAAVLLPHEKYICLVNRIHELEEALRADDEVVVLEEPETGMPMG